MIKRIELDWGDWINVYGNEIIYWSEGWKVLWKKDINHVTKDDFRFLDDQKQTIIYSIIESVVLWKKLKNS